MLKLSCAGCGAPLEIGPDLDTFACGYCGTQQRVERTGGVVALKRVEGAIKAVQRGTDRTAAELALVRLDKEIAEAELTRRRAIEIQQKKDAVLPLERRKKCYVVFAVTWFLSMVVFAFLVGRMKAPEGLLLVLPTIVAGIFASRKYRVIKVPPAETPRIAALWDAHIRKLQDQRASNRALLNA